MGLTVGALIVGVLAFALYVFFVAPLWLLPSLERLTPNIVYRVNTIEPLVALSFDDGPHSEFTPQVLAILGRSGAKATFFLIGQRALRETDLVTRIRTAGHEIGNHYFENVSTLFHSDAKFLAKLEETEKAIGQLGLLKLFRPPGGVAWPGQLRMARERGYMCVLGSAYPHDPMRPPVPYMRWLIAKNLRPGTIVILHDGIRDARKSIQVLSQILDEGKRRGLKFVAIGELMRASSK